MKVRLWKVRVGVRVRVGGGTKGRINRRKQDSCTIGEVWVSETIENFFPRGGMEGGRREGRGEKREKIERERERERR